MGRIQSNTGLTTGFDIQGTVNKLISLSSQPKLRLEARIKDYKAEAVAIGELTALVLGVQIQSDRLGNKTTLNSVTATSSASDVLKVNTSGNPITGSYNVQTIQTAQTSSAASNSFTSVDDTVQAGELVVRTGGFVDGSTSLADLRGGTGIARGKIQITDRAGSSREVDLSNTITIDDVVKQINTTSGIRVSAKVKGDRLELTDLTGLTTPTSNLNVSEVGQGRTAADLGLSGINTALSSATGDDLAFLSNSTRLSTIRDNRGLAFVSGKDLSVTLKDGTAIDIDLNETRNPTTIGQLLTTINAKDPTKLEAKLTTDGNGLEFVDKTTGSSSFAISGNAADQLGLTGVAESSGKITTSRLQGTLQGPLLSTLNGGRGIGEPTSIAIRNRAGVSKDVDLTGAQSLRDVIDKINAENTGVTASLNRNRTGIALQDTTGETTENLRVSNNDSNNTATKLKLEVDAATNSFEGGALGSQYVSEATELSKLNQGRGVRTGTFTITDSKGTTSTIALSSTNAKNVGDVLKAINDSNVEVQAKLNETGDGIVLIDTAGGANELKIEDGTNGSTALDLGIRGTSKTVTVDSVERKQIEGSQTFRLSLASTDKLSDVVKKINDANGPLTASVLTSGPSTVRLLFSSRASGEIGRFIADGETSGLSINTTAAARDAVIAVGSSADAGGILVQSSSNDFKQAIDGLSLTVVGTSTSPVQVTVAKNNTNIEKNLQLFVDQFNKVIDKLKKETSFDSATQTTGQLFGSGDAIRVQQAVTGLVTTRSFGTGKVQSLAQLGLSLSQEGKLSLDKDKLSKVVEANPSDVEAFFTTEKTGFAARAKARLEGLVGIKSGALVVKSQSLQRRVEEGGRRVDFLNVRLDAERTRLEKQFFAMEEAISKIRSNTSAISSIQNLSIQTQT
jgi:flagellar hook-associated protein 2